MSLMQGSSLQWGLETDGVTPSLDSINGAQCWVTPDAGVYAGIDSTVSPSTGVFWPGGTRRELTDFSKYGVIDPNAIWFFSQPGTGMAVEFMAR
jgi:hypothetical protein